MTAFLKLFRIKCLTLQIIMKHIRAFGIDYLRNLPEWLIESNSEMSCIEYLSNMSQEGNWAEALRIQAIAIHITESRDNFAHFILVE